MIPEPAFWQLTKHQEAFFIRGMAEGVGTKFFLQSMDLPFTVLQRIRSALLRFMSAHDRMESTPSSFPDAEANGQQGRDRTGAGGARMPVLNPTRLLTRAALYAECQPKVHFTYAALCNQFLSRNSNSRPQKAGRE